MAISVFKAFNSTVTRFYDRMISSSDRWLVDPTTGAVVGVQNQNCNGPDARFVPVDLTASQIANPTALMLADLDATYRLNVAPYSRYQSDGASLVPVGGSNESETVVPPGINVIYYDPLKIASPNSLVIEGTVRVQAYPA